MRPKELKRVLELRRDDPMWDAHTEIAKSTLTATLDYIAHLERLAASRLKKWKAARGLATHLLNQNHRLMYKNRALTDKVQVQEAELGRIRGGMLEKPDRQF